MLYFAATSLRVDVYSKIRGEFRESESVELELARHGGWKCAAKKELKEEWSVERQ